MRPLTSDAKVGQKVKGFVTMRHTGNVCFDAGFSVDVMAPRDSLRKPIEEYQEQDVYELVVTDVRGHYMCWFPTSRRRKLPCLCVATP